MNKAAKKSSPRAVTMIKVKTTGALSPFRRVSMILIAVLVLLVGCSNPQNYDVAKLTHEQRVRVRQILTADQMKKLDDWTNRNATASRGLPSGVTVQQALNYQDDWLAGQKIEEAKADRQRKRTRTERAAKQVEFAQMLSVALVSKINKVQEGERKVVALEIAYDNKTDKDIQGVKGLLKLVDNYGDAVIDLSRSYDRGISARQTVVDRDAAIPINQLIEPQVKLWDTDFEKIKSTFELQTIIFKDGTRMSAPE